MSHSKFKDIVFPFFARKHNPYSVIYKKDKVLVKVDPHSKVAFIDNVTSENKNLSYFERLSNFDTRVSFEFTCRNLTELLNAKVYWGVDSTGKVFDLVNKERFPTKLARIRKIKEGLIWVNYVSYPLKIHKTVDLENADLDVLKVILLYIDYEWIIYQFTYDTKISEYINL